MTSPNDDKTLDSWLSELEMHLEVLEEEGIDLSLPQTATVEFAGSPEGRLRLLQAFQALGWQSFTGVGVEPDATVLFAKDGIWPAALLRSSIEDCFQRARNENCVFEGLYVLIADRYQDA